MARAAGRRTEGRTDLVGVRGVLVLAGFVVALIVAFLFSWPRLVEAPALQDELDRLLRAAVGPNLRLEGDTRLELLPRPRVTIAQARVREAVAAGTRLTAERIEVDLAPLALLRGRIEPRAVRLQRPRLDLAGATWDSLPGIPAEGGLAGLQRIEVRDGAVVGLPTDADAVGLVAVRDGPHGLRLDGSAVIAGEPVRVAIAADGVRGSAPYSATIRLESGPADAAFRAEFVGQIAPGPAASGELRVSLEKGPPPAWLPWSYDLGGTLEARLTADAGRVELAELVLVVAGAELRGDLAVDLADGGAFALALNGNAVTLTPDLETGLTRLLAAARDHRVPAGRVDLQLASLAWSGEFVRRLGLEAELAPDGTVALRRLDAILPGQAVLGWSGAALPGSGTVAGEVTLQAAELRPLLAWLGVPDADLPPGGLATLDLSARAEVGPERIALDGLQARLDASRIEGALVYARTARPRLDLQLAADRLNTALYAAPPASWAGWPHRLAAVDGSLDLTVASLTHDLLRASEVRVQAELEAGQLTVGRLEAADLGGAEVALGGTWDLPTGAWDATGTLATAEIKPILRLLRLPPPLEIDRLAPLRVEVSSRHEAGRTSLDLRLAARDAEARLTGELADPIGAGDLDLRLTAGAGEAGTVLQALGWPAAADRPTLGPLALTARADGSAGPVAIAADAAIGDNRLVAALDLDRTVAPARVAGSVRAPLLDTVLLAALYQSLALPLDVPPGNPLLWPGVWPRAPLAWGWLDGPHLDLALDIERLRHKGAELGAVAAHPVLADGVLRVEGVRAPVAGGTLAGSVELAGRGGYAVLATELRLADARVQDLAAAMTPGSTVEGLLDLTATATGQGRSIAEIVGSLAGSGALTLRDGRLTGVALGPPAAGDQATALLDAAALRGPFTLSAGTLTSDPPGLLLTHPAGEAVIDLRLDLLAWILDARLAAGPLTRRYLGPPGRVRSVAAP